MIKTQLYLLALWSSLSKGTNLQVVTVFLTLVTAENLQHSTQEPVISSQSEEDEFSAKFGYFLNVNLIHYYISIHVWIFVLISSVGAVRQQLCMQISCFPCKVCTPHKTLSLIFISLVICGG